MAMEKKGGTFPLYPYSKYVIRFSQMDKLPYFPLWWPPLKFLMATPVYYYIFGLRSLQIVLFLNIFLKIN